MNFNNMNPKFLILLILFSLSYQKCTKGENFCVLCELATDLCKECEYDIMKPDDKGGCEGIKECTEGKNYCSECNTTTYLCQTCEEGFVPDNNGGCSKVEYCEVAVGGECKMCIDNYALIYRAHNYLECVSMDSEELLNCEKYDINGHCLKCKENYYLNAGDNKCSNTKNCFNSTKGICDKCEYNYYLDKSNNTQYLCLSNEDQNNFWKCSLSDDGKNCSQCFDPYYLSENKLCVKSKYCQVGVIGAGKCKQCYENYFLTKDEFSCTISGNCIKGFGHNAKCEECEKEFYIDLNDGICYSNQENNDKKFCYSFKDKCTKCIDGYYLGQDSKCSNTTNCYESNIGICSTCIDGYHLGKLDYKCTNISNCIKTNYYQRCEECDDNYFLFNDTCVNDDKDGGKYKNCKMVYYYSDHCDACKNGFYIDESDYLCYSNQGDDNQYYKCSIVKTDSEGKKSCEGCESPYYLGEDKKCSSINGCAKSETPDICLECIEGMCQNHLKKTCEQNSYIDEDYSTDENNGVCFRCRETNIHGTQCEKCEEGYTLSSDGFCINETLCDKKSGNDCIQCKQNVKTEEGLTSYCLNDKFGCVDSLDGCLKCNDIYHFNECSECFSGYYFDDNYKFCFECLRGCDTCTNSDNCGKCKEEGYYIIKEETSPEAYDAECGECGRGCKICTNDGDCEICYPGYYLNNVNNMDGYMRCSGCSTFCEQCLDNTYCLKCFDGYYLALSGDNVICEYRQTDSTTE